MLTIVVLISLILLLVVHEASHFWAAKIFKIPVEEFGIGYPPRLFARKIKNTLYSLNLIPFGAFVRIDEEIIKQKPIFQRMIVVLAGVVSFWLVAALLIGLVLMIGAPVQVTDETEAADAFVQVSGVIADSPAGEAGLKTGDIIVSLAGPTGESISVNEISDVQAFSREYLGQEISMGFKRGEAVLNVFLTPRSNPPQGEGPLGIALVRVVFEKQPWFSAFFLGFRQAFQLTGLIISGLARAVKNIFIGQPSGLQLVGPVGIFNLFVQSGGLGAVYFFQTLALISLNLAVFNALPIPVTDGGQLLFLLIEKVKKRPVEEKIQKGINLAFFLLLIFLMLLVTIKDLKALF